MPVELSPNIHEEIFNKVKLAFPDFPLFDQLISSKLRSVINDANTNDIDTKSVRKCTEKYFDISSFQTEQQKLLLSQIQLILRTTYVVILSYHEKVKALLWSEISTLLENYPQFQGLEDDELEYLLAFRNALRMALFIIPARLNKQLLLKVAARLEGSGQEYITGGGQKPCVTRRVEIYEQEGNIQPEKRTDRIRIPKTLGKKRQNGQQTVKDLKLLRLASEEVRQLTKEPSNEPKPKIRKHHVNSNHNLSAGGMMLQPNQQQQQHQQAQPQFLQHQYGVPFHPYYPQMVNGVPYYPVYGMPMVPPPGAASYMNDLQPNFSHITPIDTFSNNYPSFLDDSIVTDSMEELLAFGQPQPPLDSISSSSLPVTAKDEPPTAIYDMPPPVTPRRFLRVTSSTIKKEEGNQQQLQQQPSVQPSSTFAPVLNREQSELIDRLLLPDSDFWLNNNQDPAVNDFLGNHPLSLMRDISWDIYNGTFESDLKNIFGSD
jgi:hypothetical protein